MKKGGTNNHICIAVISCLVRHTFCYKDECRSIFILADKAGIRLVKRWGILFVIICVVIQLFPMQGRAQHVVSAEAALLMEAESGRVLYGKKEHEPLRIASITKIMTAILAIESNKMGEIAHVSKRAEQAEGSSIYLRAGEKMKVEDLVYGLMLRSGNDAAIAIAEHVAGSVEGFVYLMNEKANELGMTNTVFQNPHGLDDHEDHYSTAYDMAILSKYAMENEEYEKISKTKRHRVKGETTYVWTNKNRLLTELYPYSTGGKTGFTKRAQRTLVSTASKDGMDVIAVTLNAPNDWHDHMYLCNWAFDTFKMTTLVSEGVQKEIQDGFYKDHIFAPYTFTYPLADWERDVLKKAITLYKPPSKEKQKKYVPPSPVGKIDFHIENEKIGQIPLFYDPPVEKKKSIWERIIHIFFLSIGVTSID